MNISFVKSIYALTFLLLGISACSQTGEDGYTTTSSGLKIKYLSEGEGVVADSGDILLMYMKYFHEDSLLSSPEMAEAIPVQYVTDTANQVFEAFGMLKKGDSAHFQVSAEELFSKTFSSPIPPGIESESPITFQIGVQDVMSMEDFQAYQMEQMRKQQEEALAQQAGQLKQDSLTINEYITSNEIDAQATDTGLHYVITKEGGGIQPSTGDSVFVHYILKLLDGTEIQSSYEGPNGPYGFILGTGNAIQGWHEGIALLNEGAKATLYVPSPLAYGPQSMGPISPNSILIFDVELIDVIQ